MPPRQHLCSMSQPQGNQAVNSSSMANTSPATNLMLPPDNTTIMATAPQAVQPTYVTLVPTQPNVKVIRISQSDLERIAVLDRGTNNWATWSDAMQNLLLLNHGGTYILGTLPHPNDTGSAANWDLNNLCIIAALHTRSTPEEQDF
ncbi:hypothetical protein PAXRUDRAFT_17027 [Paxillus rubicundulus Ve08.2h10]|uniref:Uncharacterized protein n=1 Tax=Paxillus rubicundulus Ve08.2h10 TaxID=930991 RepID=A0A0D0D3P1_9AGAM|nr:hypothetical protein PAXRUDRAFT_17027 [Paxillus rubicundulus Ve08.2h10]